MTTAIKRFSELGIPAPEKKGFIGESVTVKKILGKEIIIHFAEVEPSKFTEKGDGKRLTIQITFNNEKRVVWSNSLGLRKQVMSIKKEDLPVYATIIEENEHHILK